ncbi:hypothetical protein DACRYDRAFT_23027 [Dacryopinax primogenitus]|uniref:Uncharacterized protein n=1 Tax=Dacryopinax primogenitus (strain DJM 731) TaxID=1858805 RepID=M5G423_DACPD|nr:uncharacterized protein DACRYDRAFT_23027 [Dacryopinax primogenitus]EJU00587.1 hypothetical protein DACRYDRAFT_23027 [Dacryopinax primogenitus]
MTLQWNNLTVWCPQYCRIVASLYGGRCSPSQGALSLRGGNCIKLSPVAFPAKKISGMRFRAYPPRPYRGRVLQICCRRNPLHGSCLWSSLVQKARVTK